MKNAQETMSRDIVWSTPDSSLTEIARLMIDCDCGEIPLVNGPNDPTLAGVITDRDIVCRTLGVGKNPMNCTAQDIMTSPVITGDLDMNLSDCIDIMEENQIRRLPIVDEKDHLCGLLSQADIIRNLEDDAMGVELLERLSTPSDQSSKSSL